jgi:hypothetical protein
MDAPGQVPDSCQFIAGWLQQDELLPVPNRIDRMQGTKGHGTSHGIERFGRAIASNLGGRAAQSLADLSPKRIILLKQPEGLFVRQSIGHNKTIKFASAGIPSNYSRIGEYARERK